MRIAPISNANVSIKSRWIKNSNDPNVLIQKVNKKNAEMKVSHRLTLQDRVADMLLNSKNSVFPNVYRSAVNEFDSLPKNEQDVLLLAAKCRKD